MRWRSISVAGTAGRTSRSAQRALVIQVDTPELAQDNEFTVLSAPARGRQRAPPAGPRRVAMSSCARRSISRTAAAAARAAEEGARLLAAEWALDDRDAPRALELLGELPQGVARRTHALRLRLQATRLGRLPQEALKTARLLAKHQGFSKIAAQGPAALARVRIAGHGARHRSAEAASGCQFDAVDRRDAVRRGPSRRSRVCRSQAFDDARGMAATALGSAGRARSPDEREVVALSAGATRSAASVPTGCRAWRPHRPTFPREGARGTRSGLRTGRTPAVGEGPTPARTSRQRTPSLIKLRRAASAWLALADARPCRKTIRSASRHLFRSRGPARLEALSQSSYTAAAARL